ncbi:hypothetical protein HOH87_05385 [bacterium]|jgi:hypothetical protein|nr:hypothetical protein [bacterium]
MTKPTSHPKIIIDVDQEFKQTLVDICQLKKTSMKDYVLGVLKTAMTEDSEQLAGKLEMLNQIRAGD